MTTSESAVADSPVQTRAGFNALHAHRFLFRVGLCLAGVFAWVFVFEYFFSMGGTVSGALYATALVYILMQLITAVMTPISAAHLRRGVKHSIVFGALLLGAAYIYLGATLEGLVNGAPPSWGIAFFAILLGAYRALYWIPYQLSGGRALGESSRTSLVYEVIIALMPAFAGLTLIAVPFAPLRLLFGAAVFAAISLIPLIAVKDSSENFSWSYGRSLSEFLADRHTALRIESILQGIQGAVLFLVWPLAIFLIVGSDYQLLGYILTATLVAVLFLRTFWRGFMRKTGLEHSTTAHVATSVSGWALRLFAWTPVVIFIADSYSHATAPRRTFTLDASVLEQAADSGSFVDEYTALKEIGLACGRIIIAAVFAVLLFATTLPVAFATVLIVAALASAASIILERRVAPSRY